MNDDVYAGLDPELRAFARADVKADSTSTGAATESPSPVSMQDAPLIAAAQSPEPELKDELEEMILKTKSRKAQVNAGALFNCALAEFELNQCFLTGSWWDKSQLCEVQKGAFWGCLEGNKKALNILGYGEASNSKAQNQALLEKADELVCGFISTIS